MFGQVCSGLSGIPLEHELSIYINLSRHRIAAEGLGRSATGIQGFHSFNNREHWWTRQVDTHELPPPKSLLYTGRMNVPLSPDLEATLARAAGTRGCNAEALAREAIERLVDDDEWFTREVEQGLAQIERGEVLSHEAVGARLALRVTDTDTRR